MDIPRVLIERSVEVVSGGYAVGEIWNMESDEGESSDGEQGEVGGYDVEVEGTLLKELECSLCSLILRQPVQLEECGHCMCKTCLEKWKKQSRAVSAGFRCPICRMSINSERIFENKMMHRMVMNLKVLCTNNKKKCLWKGELRDLETHKERDCEYEEVRCSYEGCTKRFQRCYVTLHEERCAYRISSCDYCEERIRVRDQKNHLKTCSHIPVDCIEMCNMKVIRCQLEKHLKEECPLHTIACSFSGIGCEFECVRKYMKNHMEESVNSHLALSVRSNEQLKRMYRSQANTISELRDAVRQLQSEMTSCKKRMRSMDNLVPSRRRSLSISSDASSTNENLQI